MNIPAPDLAEPRTPVPRIVLGAAGPADLVWPKLLLRDVAMQDQDATDRAIIAALDTGGRAAWDAFVALASGPLWAAAARATPRRAEAEALFTQIMQAWFAARQDLSRQLGRFGTGTVRAFLDSEIDAQLSAWMLELFQTGAPGAAEVFVRLFARDIRLWVARATPAQARAGVDDRVQEVFVGLLAESARRIRAYAGSAPLRAYLRRVCVNLAIEAGRREQGRVRPGADPARSGRPRLVSIDVEDDPLELTDDGPDGEQALIDTEDLLAEAARLEAVKAALAALPTDARRVLVARFVDGRKPREIAEAEGRDVKDIYRILERNLAQLKVSLGGRPS
ncbi:MAG: sigma-70 family RNA polymerase sigma factor [Rhodobacteraceae bacterium]|nr:sigma-70 family RNA polymerase sigma factor [Paracoccaceae bacterium]